MGISGQPNADGQAAHRPTAFLGPTRTHVNGHDVFACVSVGLPADSCPVVLVHGVIASHRYMIPTAERLAASRRVYVPDLPGFGHSSKPSHPLTVPELADVLAAWLPAVGLERAVFIGNSFGCQVVANLAARHPERVDRLVLISPTVDPAARSMLGQGLRLLRDAPRERLSLWPLLTRDLLDMGLRRAYLTVHIMLRDRIEDTLPAVTAPTLTVRGSLDPIVPQPWVEEMTRLLPAGNLVTLRGAAHAINYSAPDALIDVIEPFITHGSTAPPSVKTSVPPTLPPERPAPPH